MDYEQSGPPIPLSQLSRRQLAIIIRGDSLPAIDGDDDGTDKYAPGFYEQYAALLLRERGQ
jgi:hypothetical protein